MRKVNLLSKAEMRKVMGGVADDSATPRCKTGSCSLYVLSLIHIQMCIRDRCLFCITPFFREKNRKRGYLIGFCRFADKLFFIKVYSFKDIQACFAGFLQMKNYAKYCSKAHLYLSLIHIQMCIRDRACTLIIKHQHRQMNP